MGLLGMNSGPLEEQPVLSTSEPSFLPCWKQNLVGIPVEAWETGVLSASEGL